MPEKDVNVLDKRESASSRSLAQLAAVHSTRQNLLVEVPTIDAPALRARTTDGAEAASIIGAAKAVAISVQYPSAWVLHLAARASHSQRPPTS